MDDYAEITITKRPLTLEDIEFEPLPPDEMLRLREALAKEIDRQAFAALGIPRERIEPTPRCNCRGMIHRWDCHCMAS